MKFRQKKRGIFQETAASSDLAFLLIIYFLVMAGFNVNQGFLMNLPARNSTRLVMKEDLMRFEMDAKGIVFYEGNSVSMAQAETAISSVIGSHPNLAVVLLIDPGAPWQQVVSFVELAQKLKVDSFSFNMKRQT